MSTALRIVILVVEIIAYIVIFLLKNRSLRKKDNYTNLDKTRRYAEFGMTSLILTIGIIFLFPAHIFLSYKKIASVTVFIITSSAWFLNNKVRSDFYENKTFSKVYFYITYTILGASIIAISSANSSILEPAILVDHDFTTESYHIEDELKDIGDSKIAEIINEEGETICYFFIVEDEFGNEIAKVIKPSEFQYALHIDDVHAYHIDKSVHTSIYSYPEKKISTEIKESIGYRFYINENLITKIKM